MGHIRGRMEQGMNKVVFWKIIFLNSSINNESKLSTRGAEIIK